MKYLLLPALAALVLTTACKKDDNSAPATMQVSGTLAPANEVPAVTTAPAATGTITGTYTPSTKVLNYTVTFSGLSGPATGAHIHFGDAKHKGSIWLPFTGVPSATSGTITGTATLTTATSANPVSQSDSLTLGHTYVNVHTANNAGGEIRATVVVK